MLSGIQIFLEKNRKWLFGFLLMVIVVPFVFTIGNTPGLIGRKRGENLILFGYDLNDPKKLENVVRDGAASIALQTGSEENAWLESAQGYAFYRLLLLRIAHDLLLPKPSEETLYDFIKTRPLFLNESKEFNVTLYNAYFENWKKIFGETKSLCNLLIEDYLCDQVRKIAQTLNCCLSQECAAYFKSIKANYTLDYIVVKNNEKAPENISEELLRAYYQAHQEDYRIGQRADITLLFFDHKKYASKLPVISESDLEKYYNEHKDLFKHEDAVLPFNEVREKVKLAFETEKLSRLAEESASAFAVDVYDKNIALNSEDWKQALDRYDIRCIHSIAPYSKATVPEKKGLPKDILLKAFDLDEDHFLSDPMQVKNGIVLVALNKFFPTYIPEMADIRNQVIEDVKKDELQKAFDKKIEALSHYLNTVTVEMAAQKEGLTAQTLENFTIETGFASLIELLSFHSIIEFTKNLPLLPLNHWSQAYKDNEGNVVFFYCKTRELPVNFENTDAYKTFADNFIARQQMVSCETLLREILENAMNCFQKR